MHLKVDLSWSESSTSLLAYLDSGAAGGSFIALDFARRLNIPMLTRESISVSGFTGQNSTSSSLPLLQLDWSLVQITLRKYLSTF